jgi:hypothetical protein
VLRRRHSNLPPGLPGAFEYDQRLARGDVLGLGTLACTRCDAPIGIGSEALSPRVTLSCPFCAHSAPLREFLSLAPPTRPTRVLVRVSLAG